MKVDAHYYGVLAFARACGFKKEAAWSVAYSSQFVDDAKINQLTIAGPTYGIDLDCLSPPSLLNMATCHSYTRIKTFNLAAMINNTCAFHFVPGCVGDGFAWKMACRPRGVIIESIAEEVVSKGDLVTLGILLHAWADSFAHEGFSGLLSKVNDINKLNPGRRAYFSTDLILPGIVLWFRKKVTHKRFDTIFDYMVPAYGHAQALHYPDEPYMEWSYGYDHKDVYYHGHDGATVDNRKRYREAFDSITEILDKFLEKHPKYGDPSPPQTPDLFERLYEALLMDARTSRRVKHWQETLKRLKLLSPQDKKMLDYDKGAAWFEEAFTNYDKERFNRRIVRGVLQENFLDSHWYQYYGAVRWYKERFHFYADQQGLAFNHEPYLNTTRGHGKGSTP